MSTGSEEQIEEGRRLFYVALTRAKDFLEVCFPLRYYVKKRGVSDRHSYAQLTRFIPPGIVDRFEKISLEPVATADIPATAPAASPIRQRIAAMWE
jgi:DNA helicase-2/ATP-dependent DNA helicase PcrA